VLICPTPLTVNLGVLAAYLARYLEEISMPKMAQDVLVGGKDRAIASVKPQDSNQVECPHSGRVAIFCNQGVWWKGEFYSEYPFDNGIHEEAILDLPWACRKWGVSLLILSGGMTQSRVPQISEAQGAAALLQAVGADFPPGFVLGKDEISLDLPENILLGALAARLLVGPACEMSTILILCTHLMKSRRVGLAVSALGLSEKARFVGFFPAYRLASPAAALAGEDAMIAKCSNDDPLALAEWAERRRRARWTGAAPYETRLDGLAKVFPDTIGNLERLRGTQRTHADLELLRKAFQHEVIMGKPV
jgi:hypothetical protein